MKICERWNFWFCQNLNLEVLKFYFLTNISPTESSKLIFLKQVTGIFAFENIYFEKDLSSRAEIFRICCSK